MHKLLVGSTLLGLVVSGCSNHQIDPARYRIYRPGLADGAAPSVASQPSRVSAAPVSDRPPDLSESTGSVSVQREHRPWPRVGTPEWYELQAEEAEQEKRVQQAIASICRC
jgi:hypothetical protein